MKGYTDAGSLPEDTQIRLIGERALAGDVVGFIVENHERKIARYERKLRSRFPTLTVERIGALTSKAFALKARLTASAN